MQECRVDFYAADIVIEQQNIKLYLFFCLFLPLNIPNFALSSVRAPATPNPRIFQEQMRSSPRVEISKTFTSFMLQEIFDEQRAYAIMHRKQKKQQRNDCNTMQWESSLSTRPADDCSFAFASHALLPSVRKLRGDIWVTAGYEVENQNPPECRPSAGGGTSSVSARITSHWTPSEAKVCGQISSHNGQDDKQQPQSHALCTLTHRRGKYARSSRPITTFLSSLGGFMVRTS